MNISKAAYLSMPVVANFVTYFAGLIDGEPVQHKIIIRDPKLPKGDARKSDPVFTLDCLEDAFNGYWWDRGGYQANYEKLKRVERLIRNAIDHERCPGAPMVTLDALCQVLEWGAGGTGQRLYTSNKAWAVARLDTLIESLRMGRTEMTSDSPDLSVFSPSTAAVSARMNAGFTKYYALACDDVLIYDGRVGAALGFLVRNFCKSQGIHTVPEQLAFRWGAQSGSNPLNRDPSSGSYVFEKLPTEGPLWANWNIRANWVVNAARARSRANWVRHSDGLRRIEAALFVMGYSMPQDTSLHNIRDKSFINKPNDPIKNNLSLGFKEFGSFEWRFSNVMKQKLSMQKDNYIPQRGRGKPFVARSTSDGVEVIDCLGRNENSSLLQWGVFDAVEELLRNRPNHRAIRGDAMNAKLGDKRLPIDSVEGCIAIFYGKKIGESVFRRISPVANLLVWADLCSHAPGELVMRL